MWQDSPFAEPVPSFQQPVVAPDWDPDASPTKTVEVACVWLPYIRGALYQLLLQSTWDPAGPDLLHTQQRVFNLIDLFSECSSGVLPFACPYPFSEGDEGFGVIDNTAFTPSNFGYYVAGQGFACGDEVMNADLSVWGYGYFAKSITPITVTGLSARFDLHQGTPYDHLIYGGVYGKRGGTFVLQRLMNIPQPDGDNQTLAWTGSATEIDEIQFLLLTHHYPAGSGVPGSGMLREIVASGVGPATCS